MKILNKKYEEKPVENINEDIFKNASLLENHFKNQGNCKSINIEFQDQVEKELSNIEKYIK